MPTSNFDIYECQGQYLAITSDVRRSILEALASGGKQLPELVEITGKSKPTLSSIHMKELLEQKVITEEIHPEDSRRKIYKLAGRKIGSSNVPLDTLREAVKEYVTVAPMAARFPLSVTFSALAAAPASASLPALRAQAHHLGLLVGQVLELGSDGDPLLEIGKLLEREGLAKLVRLELEGQPRLVVEGMSPGQGGAACEREGGLLAGFAEGLLAARGHEQAALAVSSDAVGLHTFTLERP